MTWDIEKFERFCSNIVLEDGRHFKLHPFQRRMLADLFSGTRETLIIIPKKNGKSTLLGALALYHLCTTDDAECVIAAASRDQAAIMLRQAQGFIRRSPGLSRRLRAKNREIVHREKGGRVRILASDVDTADGVIPTLALVDELHRHKSPDLYGVFRDGLGPRDGRMVTISTAGADEDSPLGHLRAKAYVLPGFQSDGVYRYVTADGFAMHEWALEQGDDRDDLDLVKRANPAPWQTREELRGRRDSPSMTPWQWARFACGVWGLGEERAFDSDLWVSLARPGEIPAGSFVTLGFDGSRRWDATGLVACEVETGRIQVVGCWERPPGAHDDWEVPEDEVNAAVAYAFDRWDVWRLYGDPPYWESALDRWAGAYDEDRLVRWWTNRIKATAQALRAFVTDMQAGEMHHDGDEALTRHIANAARHETRMVEADGYVLWTIRKDSQKSPRKIDLAMAALLAWEARGDAISAGAGPQNYGRAAW